MHKTMYTHFPRLEWNQRQWPSGIDNDATLATLRVLISGVNRTVSDEASHVA